MTPRPKRLPQSAIEEQPETEAAETLSSGAATIQAIRTALRREVAESTEPAEDLKVQELIHQTIAQFQVAACETKEDFRQLFILRGIEEDVWRSGKELRKVARGLRDAIAERFREAGGWTAFLDFMGPRTKRQIDASLLELNYVEQIEACETREDFLQLFALHQLSERVWRNSQTLREKGFESFITTIRKRFQDEGWKGFLQFMGPPTKVAIDESILTLPFTKQVAACETREDFLELFSLQGWDKDLWTNSTRLQTTSPGFYNALRTRFASIGGWDTFMAFMGETPNISYIAQVSACETRDDFLQLFARLKITEDVWRVSTQLSSVAPGLHAAIHLKFQDRGKWPGFLQLMGPRTKRPINESLLTARYTEQVQACETQEDFLSLFRLHGLEDESWRSSGYLQKNHKGLYKALRDRFEDQGGWSGFLQFMGAPVKQRIDASLLVLPYTKQVAACETREDFLALFALHGVDEETWQDSVTLANKGHSRLQEVIFKRFKEVGGWKGFLTFMNALKKPAIDKKLLEKSYTEQVAACETREDFLALFALHGLDEETWRIGMKLTALGYGGLQYAIYERFRPEGSWEGFIAFMDGRDETSLNGRLESLGLEDAVALLADRPAKLKVYLAISHPELLEEEIDRLVAHAFKRLHSRRVFDYEDFEQALAACTLTEAPPRRTAEAAVLLEGTAQGADSILVEGAASTRRIRVNEDGMFRARIALAVGSQNRLRLIPLHHGNRQTGPATEIVIHQTGTPDDIEALVGLLGEMGQETLAAIRTETGRMEYVVRQAEQVLIRKFSGSFAAGKAYVEQLIADANSPVVRTVLKKVLQRFRQIDRTTYPNVRDTSPLYFFQKYCVAEIQRRIEAGERGVVLANDPGLGKTRTALVAVNGDPATIIAPNSVVTSWTEEASKALTHSDILTLQNLPYARRLQLLRDSGATHVVTNVEFLRGHEDDERYGLLSDDNRIVVHDEAHGLLNLGSEQSKGARRLQAKFHLFLSATPCKDPKTLRRMLHNVEPDDPRFASDAAFTRAFPANDPEALRTLSIFKNRYMIRFTKDDVLEEMDPNLPIEQQRHRLPRKEYVSEEDMGSYILAEKQCQAIYELFLDWPAWCKKYDRYVPRDEVAKLDALRGNQFALAKVHALRQVANNPSYIGATEVEDPKAKELQASVEAFLAEGRKVVIFCQYNAQAEKYAEILKAHCPSQYTGVVSNQGLKTNELGRPMHFRTNEDGGWVLDGRGLPLEDPEGSTMLALDYERIAFQNASERRVMICTYAAGSVGVTFTAGKAAIFDDLPADCIQEIQAEDRIHRIDHEHQTHNTVRYARMVSRYPESFLERMRQVWVRPNNDGTYTEVHSRRQAEKEQLQTAYDAFFAQGTFDQVRASGLQTQRTRFRLINDGVVDTSDLPDIPMSA